MSKKDDKLIDRISAIAAEKALEHLEKENTKLKREKKDWRLRNTRLLVENYRLLAEHCQIVGIELEAYEGVIFDSDDLDLHALMKYKAKTVKMLLYFDEMFKAYRNYSYREGEAVKRRYEIVNRLYISGDSKVHVNEIAEFYNVDRRTVYRDVDKAIEELSIFMFGIDSLNDLSKMSQSGRHSATK